MTTQSGAVVAFYFLR